MQELPEIQQPLDAVEMGGMNDGAVDHHVVVEEFGRTRRVRENAADRAGDEEHILGPVRPEPVVHRRLIAKIELLARRGQQILVAFGPQVPQDRRADEAAMARDKDPR